MENILKRAPEPLEILKILPYSGMSVDEAYELSESTEENFLRYVSELKDFEKILKEKIRKNPMIKDLKDIEKNIRLSQSTESFFYYIKNQLKKARENGKGNETYINIFRYKGLPYIS